MKLLILSLIILLSSCSVFDNEQDITSSDILTEANDPILSVQNMSNRDVYFFVIETQTSYLVNFAFTCANSELALKRKQRTEISYSDIPGWHKNAESVWFYWTNCKGAQGSKTIKL